jgi:hypothetical protein
VRDPRQPADELAHELLDLGLDRFRRFFDTREFGF